MLVEQRAQLLRGAAELAPPLDLAEADCGDARKRAFRIAAHLVAQRVELHADALEGIAVAAHQLMRHMPLGAQRARQAECEAGRPKEP